MRPALLLALVLVLAAPLASAQVPPTAADAWVTLTPGEAIENDPSGVLALNASEGERWIWDLNLSRSFTVIEFQGRGFGLERARQLVPILVVPEDRYPLFHLYPNDRVWEADAPSQVFHVTGDGDDLVLRVGIPGPQKVQLILEIDRIAPSYDVGAPQSITPIGFYLETQTTEMALGDLQVREAGAAEWIRNPTPEYHVLQKFPVQGLDANKDHEAQVVFEDWAGNKVTSPVFVVRTAAAPMVEPIVIRAREPAPNTTVSGEDVTVRATIESGVPLARGDVRLFFDLKEVTDFEVHGADVTYKPGPLAAEMHRVGIEAMNAEGGSGRVTWSFTVEGKDTPAPGAAWIILALLAAVGTMRASRRA